MNHFLNHYCTKFITGVSLLFLMSLQPILAFQSQVHFQEITFEQAEKAAKQQDKFIFVDVFNAGMNNAEAQKIKKAVFSNPKVAAYFNEHFINVKMNMSTERGKAFAPKLQMLMYPTMVFFGYGEAQLGSIRIHAVKDSTEKLLKIARKAFQEGSYLAATANSKTEFQRNPFFEQLLAASQEQNKPVVIDFYTTWCRPCIQMDRKVFTLDRVAKLYNENFILAKYDAEKGEGIDLNKKYDVWAYPTYVFLNSEGEQIHRVEGYTEADSMIVAAEKALNIYKRQGEESASINFIKQSEGWAAIKAKAIEKDRFIFFDGYAVWCGPCKKMDRTVFRDPEVTAFFNEHFVNAKFDMEKGEGIELRERFNIQAYPTYLFIDPSTEEIVHRVVGSREKKEFMAQVHVALSGDENLAAMEKAYQQGNRGTEFIAKYLEALDGAYLHDKMAGVAVDYLQNRSHEELLDKTNWVIFDKYYKAIDTPVFMYVLNNRSVFQRKFGKEQVNDKIYNIILGASHSYVVTEKDGKQVLDEEGFSDYLAEIKSWNLPREQEIILFAKIRNYEISQQWDRFVDVVEEGLKIEGLLSSLQLWNYAMFTEANCEDKTILLQAVNWVEIAAERDKAGHLKSYCMEMQAKLLEKAGRAEEAKAILAKLENEKKENKTPETNMGIILPLKKADN